MIVQLMKAKEYSPRLLAFAVDVGVDAADAAVAVRLDEELGWASRALLVSPADCSWPRLLKALPADEEDLSDPASFVAVASDEESLARAPPPRAI